MKKGKLILGAAAFIVTTAAAFAFKVSRPFSTHRLFATVSGSACFQATCWTNASSGTAGSACHITTANHAAISNLYTQRTSVNNHCKTKYTGLVTHLAN